MELIEKVQFELLNSSRRAINLEFCNTNGSYEEQSAFRLLSEYQIVVNRQQPTADFYVALRSFIGAIKSPLVLPELLSDEVFINRFSLVKLANNKFDISRKYPQNINASFVNRVFEHQSIVKTNNGKYSLYTSPFIFQNLSGGDGRRYFKNVSQQLAINAALTMKEGNTALICMPTGSGKSMITQALALQQKVGLTIVIVPTISLAIDQEKEAKSLISNCSEGEVLCYHGGLDVDKIVKMLHSRITKLLFISPEALQLNPKLENEISELNRVGHLKNIVIDEAHMVVEWGSAFRLDYQTLESFRNEMIHNNLSLRTYLLSATYDRHEIAVLKSLFSKGNDWLEIRCDALRNETLFHFIQANNNLEKQAYSNKLIDLLPRPMIIYVRKPDDATELKNLLEKDGYSNVKVFTGETNRNERDQIIEEWKRNKFSTMIATSAFGIGVDKRDVRTVLHLHIPENPNFYYQEVGRGGRDGYPSLGVMCANPNQDLDEAHGFASRILSEDKLIERWFAMHSHSRTLKQGSEDYIEIDTSILPEYSKKGDEYSKNQMHIMWNMYVLMLLRRYELIKIIDVRLKNKDAYDEFRNVYLVYITLTEKGKILLRRNNESEQTLRDIRKLESDYYESNYRYVADSIKNVGKECWSEMFYSIFDCVDMYCPGCNYHKTSSGTIHTDIRPLNKKVNAVRPKLGTSLDSFIGPSREAYILASNDLKEVVDLLMHKGINGLVLCDTGVTRHDWYEDLQADPKLKDKHFSVFNVSEFKYLFDNEHWYYFEGNFVIVYGESITENQVALEISQNVKRRVYGFKAIHVTPKDFNFGMPDRNISECVEGPHYDDNIIEGVINNV